MDLVDVTWVFVLDAAVITLNGLLYIAYWLLEHLPLLLTLPAAGVVYAVFDEPVQRLAAHTPGRGRQRAPVRPHRGHQALTVAATGMWLVAGALYPTPVPWLGTAMWLLTVLALLLMPAERPPILWRCKAFIISYALLLLGFRWYLAVVSSATPQQWAAVVGTSGDAQRVIAGNRSLFITIGSWAAWFVLPSAHALYVVQRVAANPMSLVNPAQSAAQIVEAIRTRGGD